MNKPQPLESGNYKKIDEYQINKDQLKNAIELSLPDFEKIAGKDPNQDYLFKHEVLGFLDGPDAIVLSEDLFVIDVESNQVFRTSQQLVTDAAYREALSRKKE